MTQALVSKFFENMFFSYLQKQIFQYSTFLKLNSLACSFQAHLQIFKASNFQNGKDAVQLQRYCNYLVLMDASSFLASHVFSFMGNFCTTQKRDL